MKSEMKKSLLGSAKFLLLAFFLVAAGGWFFSVEFPRDVDASEAEKMKALGYAVGGSVLIGLGLGMLFFPLARLLSSFFESLFWPDDRAEVPVSYKLAEWYMQQGRYADACSEYEKIIENHPRAVEAIQGLLNVMVLCVGDVARADKRYGRALKKLSFSQRESLRIFYEKLKEKDETTRLRG
jgi:tetratricopeptide (TPR) repeat protein